MEVVNELNQHLVGREAVFKNISTSIIGGQNQDFYFRADMDRDGQLELYHMTSSATKL